MAVEELLPGLVEVTEERLGKRIGWPVTTAFIVVVFLGFGAWCLKLVVDNAVRPVISVFHVESVSVNLVEVLLVYGIGATMWAGVVLLADRMALARLTRERQPFYRSAPTTAASTGHICAAWERLLLNSSSREVSSKSV